MLNVYYILYKIFKFFSKRKRNFDLSKLSKPAPRTIKAYKLNIPITRKVIFEKFDKYYDSEFQNRFSPYSYIINGKFNGRILIDYRKENDNNRERTWIMATATEPCLGWGFNYLLRTALKNDMAIEIPLSELTKTRNHWHKEFKQVLKEFEIEL